jgi:hypothetical protein
LGVARPLIRFTLVLTFIDGPIGDCAKLSASISVAVGVVYAAVNIVA